MTFYLHNWLRPADGPGKFEGCLLLDVYVYEVSIEHPDDVVSFDDGSSYAVMRGGGATIFHDSDPFRERLNDAEKHFIDSHAGCIVHERSDGFVTVQWYRDEDRLESDWRCVEKMRNSM